MDSASAEPGSWKPLSVEVDRFLVSPGPGWFSRRLLVHPPPEFEWGDSYFLRVRVVSQ